MSVVVAIKYKDGVAIAADKQTTFGNIKTNNAVKIKKFDLSNTAIGCVGPGRDGDIMCVQDGLIDALDILKKVQVDFKYVATKVIPNIFNILKTYQRLEEENNIVSMGGEMVFATPDYIYGICSDGGIMEGDIFWTTGCGCDLARGYLETVENLKELDKEAITEVLTKSIKTACKNDAFIDDNLDYVYLER